MAKNNEKFVSRENAKTLWGYMVDLLTGKYTKPSGGIPKSDLESSVQTSLGKADTALQSFMETDPTVPSWAKATNKPSYTQDEVGDGSTYKRVTQTEKDAWSGKQNALTTTQMQAVNSGITSAGVTQISTNQANVLYGLNTGVKNLLASLLRVGTIGSSGSTITFALQGDGSIVLNGSTTNSVAIFVITETGKWATSAINGVDGYFENISYKIALFDGGNASGSGVYLDIYRSGWAGRATCGVGSNTTYDNPYIIRLCVPENKTLNNVIVKPMVCTLDAWNQSTDYQLPSLPNHDLTVLEAEDRASLTEVVDSGAKNEWNPSKVVKTYTHNGVTFTLSDDGVITANGTATGNDAVFGDIGSGAYIANKILFIEGSINSGQYGSWFFDIYDAGWQNREICYSGKKIVYKESKSTTAIWRLVISSGVTCNNTTFKPMVCDLADWKVSQKYAPYKGNFITAPICRRVRFNCTSTDYEHVTELDITIPADTYVRVSATLRFSNGEPRGIKIIDPTLSNPVNAILAINETENNYGLISTSFVVLNVGTVKTYNVYTKSASVSGNDVIITVEYLGN